MIMKHLYFIVATVLLPLLTSCHTKKQAIETVREETNTSRQTLFLIDSGKLDSMRTSFLAEFDSLVIEMPGTPIQCPGAGIVPDTATAPPRPVKAKVYGGKVSTETKSVSATSAHTQRADTVLHQSQRASDEQSHRDNTAIGKPPNLLPLYLVIAIIVIAIIYYKWLR